MADLQSSETFYAMRTEAAKDQPLDELTTQWLGVAAREVGRNITDRAMDESSHSQPNELVPYLEALQRTAVYSSQTHAWMQPNLYGIKKKIYHPLTSALLWLVL